MASKVQPIPEGYHTVTPYLIVNGAAEALNFYKQAFGAEELYRLPGKGGKIVHAELQIGSSRVMLADEWPEMNERSPARLGGTPVSLMVYVEDADAVFNRAVAAGAKVLQPVTVKFYGDRTGVLTDPFGHQWSIATHVEDLSPDEVVKRMAEAMP